MADAAEAAGVTFPDIPEAQAEVLADVLGPLVTVSNPLDYHTFIWGDGPKMNAVFSAAASSGDASMFVLDLPRADRCSTASYDAALGALAYARQETGHPIFAVSTLHDSIDEEVAARISGLGVVPLQGVSEAFAAIEAASTPQGAAGWQPLAPLPIEGELADEIAGKEMLERAGVSVPRRVSAEALGDFDSADLAPPLVLKGMGFPHKSEAGAVRLGLDSVADAEPMAGATGYLLEEMVTGGVAEVLIGMRRDPVYGATLTLGMGGVEAELLADTVTLIAPVTSSEIEAALRQFRLWPKLDGFRGRPKADVSAIVDVALKVQDMMIGDRGLSEIEINPLIVKTDGAVAVDALIRKG